MEPVELADGDLLLRPWRAADAEAVHRACQDPDIRNWTLLPDPFTEEVARARVGPEPAKQWAEATATPFGVFDAGTGELLGANGLIKLDLTDRTGEIGYWTAPWARSRGVALRSTRAVVRWAFESLGLRRLTWQAAVGNHASRLIAERAGFTIEGTLRGNHVNRRGVASDTWVGSILPGELANKPAEPGARLRAATFSRPQPVLDSLSMIGTLRLRAPEERDIDSMIRACRDEEVAAWTTVPQPYQRSDAEWFVGHTASVWRQGVAAEFAVCDADDRWCGGVSLRLTASDAAVADVGYLIAPWARRRGYASAALRVLCALGFHGFGLRRIEWYAYVGNHASRRVAEKAGFSMEGTMRQVLVQRGERRDAWVAAVLPDDPLYRGGGNDPQG